MHPQGESGQPCSTLEASFPDNVPTPEHGWSAGAEDVPTEIHASNDLVDHSIGKVVVDMDYDGLQVCEPGFNSTHGAASKCAGTVPADASAAGNQAATSPKASIKIGFGKSRNALIAIVLLAVIVIAGTLGGVLRAEHRESKGGGDTSPSPNATVPTGKEPTFVRPRSRLSVTGWRKDQGLQIVLYYQGKEGTLRLSNYDDTKSSFSYNGSYWGDSWELGMDPSADFNVDEASFAALVWLLGAKNEREIELHYLDSNRNLCAVSNLRDSAQYDQLLLSSGEELVAATNGSIAGYWPYFAYTLDGGQVATNEIVRIPSTGTSQTIRWSHRSKTFEALTGSRLAMVPLGSNITSMADWGNYVVFYQGQDGRLSCIQPARVISTTNGTLVDSWPNDAEFPSITLPAGASFAAFATARSGSIDGLVNTYVLYQEETSRISMVYLDNNSKWIIDRPDALSVADNGTDIACLTMPMTRNLDGVDGNDLDLEPASSHTNRCYFQRGGYVREFALSGTDWIELGTLPMD